MKIFIAGSRAIKSLNRKVQERIINIIKKNFTILVGDASGIDKQVQMFCAERKYNQVIVFSSNGKVRNNIGSCQ